MKMKNLVKATKALLWVNAILFIITLFLPTTSIYSVLQEGINVFLFISTLLFFVITYKNYENDETSIW